MTKPTEKKADAVDEQKPAAGAPGTAAADEAEANRLWTEMASRHSDPHGSGASSEGLGDDPNGGKAEDEDDAGSSLPDGNADPKAAAAAKTEPPTKANSKPEDQKPSTELEKPGASQDAPQSDEIWAKADKDPRTKELKAAWDAAPETARPAIEATQRRLLEQGREINRLRSERSTLKRPAAAAAPAKKDEEVYDLAKDPDWLKAKEEYPDALTAVEKVISKVMGSQAKQLDSKIAPIAETAKSHGEVLEENYLREQNVLLHKLHPDYTDAVRSEGFGDTFGNWLSSQPDEIRAMAANNEDYVKNANQVSTVFRLFKSDTGFGVKAAAKEPASDAAPKGTEPPAKPATDPVKESKRRQQLRGSETVDNRGPGVSASADKDDADYWWGHWSKKRASQEDHAH